MTRTVLAGATSEMPKLSVLAIFESLIIIRTRPPKVEFARMPFAPRLRFELVMTKSMVAPEGCSRIPAPPVAPSPVPLPVNLEL